jgi:hypothetical protein
MNNCRRCGRRAQLYLCQHCTIDLQELITSLIVKYNPAGPEGTTASGGRWWIERRSPGLLEYLNDAVLGQTRLGISARHSTDYTTPMPFNGKASALATEAAETLTSWATKISRHVETLTATGETDQ